MTTPTTTPMATSDAALVPGLDDTLHAVVQVTHEHGLPLTGATVRPGRVHVYADVADLRWWARWLAAASECRCTVWTKDADVVLYICATREGIEWVVTERVPTVLAGPILAEYGIYGVPLDTRHRGVPAAAATALADALTAHNTGGASC